MAASPVQHPRTPVPGRYRDIWGSYCLQALSQAGAPSSQQKPGGGHRVGLWGTERQGCGWKWVGKARGDREPAPEGLAQRPSNLICMQCQRQTGP